MAENLFEKIAKGIPTPLIAKDIMTARQWFRETAAKITQVNPLKLFEGNEKNLVKSINITSIGSMYSFVYDPKHKETLPYYDVYPLVFIIELYGDGFLGLNLHYLSPYYRAKLMDALYGITLKHKDTMKLQISYNILKSAARFGLFKHCTKRYLNSHIKSRLLFVEPEKWDMAMMLPTQRFVKASEETVWRNTAGLGKK